MGEVIQHQAAVLSLPFFLTRDNGQKHYIIRYFVKINCDRFEENNLTTGNISTFSKYFL